MEKYLILGSGPAAVSAAQALPGALVVDAGDQLELPLAERAASMGRKDPGSWAQEDVDWLQSTMTPTTAGVAAKLYFGSGVAYRSHPNGPFRNMHAAYQPSLAFGGLSTVWGASILPYWEREIGEWPLPADIWASHYQAVLGETGLAGVRDSLEQMFPLHHPEPDALGESKQAKNLRERMERHRKNLAQTGFRWGRSRLMVRAGEKNDSVNRLSYHPAHPPSHAQSCVLCGMCMYGCPYDLIYSSRKSILKWAGDGRIRYQRGIEVQGFHERPDRVEVWGRNLEDGQAWRKETERLFLAAGTLASTALVLGSSASPQKSARFLDSQYFTVPLFLLDSVRKTKSEPLHTLAQLFLEILPGAVSSRLIHLQIYTYNDMIHRLMEQKVGPLRHSLGFLMERAKGRLAFLQGYLHSDDSGTMEMSLDSDPRGTRRISLLARPNPRSRRVIRSVLAKLSRHAWQTGFLPIWPMLQIGEPGRGFHSGGSLPMRASIQGREAASDLLGRPFGLRRVHVVDSSVFPSIPATTITLTAMANAHRIAAEAGLMRL